MGKSNVNNRKKAAVIVVVALIIAALVSGTYAWRDYSQHKTNVLGGAVSEYDVTLSEDFITRNDWQVSDGEVTKEVNVTNTGAAGYGDVYVRVGLQELFELYQQHIYYAGETGADINATDSPEWFSGGSALYEAKSPKAGGGYTIGACIPTRFAVWPTGADRGTDASTSEDSAYILYVTSNQSLGSADLAAWLEAVGYVGHEVEWHTDAVSGEEGYFIVTEEGDINGQYGKYLVTAIEYGEDGVPEYVGNNGSDGTDWGLSEDHRNLFGDKAESNWQRHVWEESLSDPSTYVTDDPIHEHVELGYDFSNNFIRLSEWITAGKKDVAKWIIDDTATAANTYGINQYAYWGEPLKQGNTTANLIDSLTLLKQPEGKFTYALNVNLEAASLNDLVEGQAATAAAASAAGYSLFGKNASPADTSLADHRLAPTSIIDAYIDNAKANITLTTPSANIKPGDTKHITISADLGGGTISDVKADIDFPAPAGLTMEVKLKGDPDSAYKGYVDWLDAANTDPGFLLTETPFYVRVTATAATPQGSYGYTITLTEGGKTIATSTGTLTVI
jgi:hypothetical protein